MNWRALAITAAVLAIADAALRLGHGQIHAANDLALLHKPLLEPGIAERACRIVIHEKPESRVLYTDQDGSEIQMVVAADAPVRTTHLWREPGGAWKVSECLDLPADRLWVGQTLRDLSEGTVVRELTTDPVLMSRMGFGASEVEFFDQSGVVLAGIEFGQRDGIGYQIVRINKGAAELAKHSAELVGDPLAWIPSRPLEVDTAALQEIELPFTDHSQSPLFLRREKPGQAMTGRGATPAGADRFAQRWIARMAETPLQGVAAPDGPEAKTLTGQPLGTVKLRYFNGREIVLRFFPASDGPALRGGRPDRLTLVQLSDTETASLAARLSARAVFIYSRQSTFGTLPGTPSSLERLVSSIH